MLQVQYIARMLVTSIGDNVYTDGLLCQIWKNGYSLDNSAKAVP